LARALSRVSAKVVCSSRRRRCRVRLAHGQAAADIGLAGLAVAQLFGDQAPNQVSGAASRRDASVDQLARWIRNPEAFLPGTVMPTFAPVLDEAGALELAEWIRADGPSKGGS
jgi:mono/diheme cytochrome c family protein